MVDKSKGEMGICSDSEEGKGNVEILMLQWRHRSEGKLEQK